LTLAPIAGLPAEKWAALERGLALSPEKRTASVTELLVELGLEGIERLRADPDVRADPETRPAIEAHAGTESRATSEFRAWEREAIAEAAPLPLVWPESIGRNDLRARAAGWRAQRPYILLVSAAVLVAVTFFAHDKLRSATADLFALAAPLVETDRSQLPVQSPAERELAASPAPSEPPATASILESAPPDVAPEQEPRVATTGIVESAPDVVAPQPVAGAEIAVVPPSDPAPATPEPTVAGVAGEVEAQFRFAESVVAVPESDPAARVVLVRSGDASSSETIVWWTTDGTAVADEDYADLGERTETLARGEVERELFVPLIQDTVPESTETFTVHVGRYDQRSRHLDLVSSVRVEIRSN
jgi:hypothetical protein